MIPEGEMTSEKRSITHLAMLTAIAVTIYVVESFIPKPFPFLKFGLSNIVILILLISNEYRSAFIVMLSKILIGGFLSGTILSPTTVLSITGSLLSFVMMIIFIQSRIKFSIVGISILGAAAHNLGQIIAVRLILIKESSIFYLTPLLILLGIVTGIVTGYIAKIILEKGLYERLY